MEGIEKERDRYHNGFKTKSNWRDGITNETMSSTGGDHKGEEASDGETWQGKEAESQSGAIRGKSIKNRIAADGKGNLYISLTFNLSQLG